MELSHINWLAVVVAAASNFLLGGLWNSHMVFGKAWRAENKLSPEEIKKANTARVFGISFIWSLVMAFTLALFLADPGTDAIRGLAAGFCAGFGWVASGIFIIGLFERKSTRYMLINAGYMVVSFLLMGSILGAWR
jgi:hypothetical protein